MWQLPKLPQHNIWLLIGFAALAATSHILKQQGPTAGSSYQISFMIYGAAFVFLGTQATVFIIIVAHLLEYTWGEFYPWYIQSFNIATFTLAFSAAGIVHDLIDPQSMDHVTGTAGILAGLAIFTIINHLLIGLVLKLARGQSFSESGVFGLLGLMIDFSLLCMGAGTALLWAYSPFASMLGLIPLYLIYSTLRLPLLKRQTETDAKTGIFNSAYFSNALRLELDRAHRFNRPMTVVMADLDLLRNINNTYGHLAGDVVLAGVAGALQGLAREYDVVARFGGEEFGILMPETTPEEAFPLVQEMRLAVAASEFQVSTSVSPIKATMSFGVAGRLGTEKAIDEIIHCADLALYQAKQNGRNCTVIFSGDGSAKMVPLPTSESKTAEIGSDTHRRTLATNGSKRTVSPGGDVAATTDLEPPAFGDEPLATHVRVETPPGWQIKAYIISVALAAILLSAILLILAPGSELDWIGLALFAAAALLTEATSVEIYLRDTAVSTSAVPLVAGTLLFGPTGALILGLTAAIANFIKARSRLSRFIFNGGNFVIGNMLCSAIVVLIDQPITSLSMAWQAGLSITSAIIVYLSTTILVSGAIRADSGQPIETVWVERFRWLAPYFLVLGVVAFGLIFSYVFAGLLGVVVILIPLYMLRFSQKQYIDRTREIVGTLRKTNRELVRQAEEITLLNEELLLTLARSVDLRDPHVMEHSKQVSRYACLMGQELGLSNSRIQLIRKAGLLHDIGKLGIPEAILFKPSLLSNDEYEKVKVHVLIGADLISGCHSLDTLIPFVKHHHEWFDGSGYPDGLSGEDIPLEARILGLADAVEAMASDRPYKRAMTPEEILREIKRCAGAQFDPDVARAFERIVTQSGESVISNSARDVVKRKGLNVLTAEKMTTA
jgi:diguanylate cyclase (GGDEF)-like protein/putative nucleotidyltransferase with HDIG domain